MKADTQTVHHDSAANRSPSVAGREHRVPTPQRVANKFVSSAALNELGATSDTDDESEDMTSELLFEPFSAAPWTPSTHHAATADITSPRPT